MSSLAAEQLEREKLKAIRAKGEYDEASKQTVAREEVLAAGMAVRRAVLSALDGLAGAMTRAIDGEFDETRIHYLMSDAAHEFLSDLGISAQSASAALPALGKAIQSGSKPRDLLTVSQWADRHREMKSGTNAPGQWRTELTPYLREIMDSLSEHSPVRTVTFMKSSGVGGTEALYNWIGYIMHHLQNKDTMVVVPTLELRERSFNPRLTKMMEESEVLAELITTASRNKANRADLMEYGAGAKIIKAGSNSADSLRSDHLPYAACDEVDAYPWEVGDEGDPITLIRNRQQTFGGRAKTFYLSTPIRERASRIAHLHGRSDKRRYHVPCPHCGHLQPLEFGGKEVKHGLKWRLELPDAETGEVSGPVRQVLDAWYACIQCEARIDEGHKTEILKEAGHGGRACWIAGNPRIKKHRGYHINRLYAPIGLGQSWRDIAQDWINAQGDSSELKAFVMTTLGEVWSEEGDSIEAVGLQARLEDYTREHIPAALVTAGVDVQKDRLEISIVAWGSGEEGWLLDHLILPGETTRQEVWDDLAEALADAGVQFAAIDSGYNTSMVYAFCEKRRWCVAIKGVTGSGRPLIEDEKKRRQRMRARRRKGAAVEPLGVDQGKALLYARLKMPAPGKGYIHFPRLACCDDEYFAQLAAEKLVTKMRGSRPIMEWVQTRPRNEALDCMLYALAACRLSGRMPEGGHTVVKIENEMVQTSVPPRAETQEPAPRPAAKPKKTAFAKEGWGL